MGAVAIDIHKKEREFTPLTLSDKNVVKYLIMYRSKLDGGYNSSINFNIYQAGDTFDLNIELIALYADLDKLIEESNFSKRESYLITLLFDGYSFSDIYKNYEDYPRMTINRLLNKIVNTIAEKDKKRWSKVFLIQNSLKKADKYEK